MAAFFTAVVRAPMTGIVLIIEMTSYRLTVNGERRNVLRDCEQ
jgi:hypothetical protein